MIEWKKYDQKNPPKLYETYLILTPKFAVSAWLDKSPYSDDLLWVTGINDFTISRVTHYALFNNPDQ